MPAVFQVLVDTQQQRISQESVSMLCGAQDWDLASSNAVYPDGVTGTMLLLMGCFDPNGMWDTSNSGIYSKLPYTDFSLSPAYSAGPPPTWQIQAPNTGDAPYYGYANNMSGAGGILNYDLPINQPVVVEFSVNRTTNGQNLAGAFGYGSTGTVSDPVVFQFHTDNSCDVYENGVYQATYTISGQIQAYGQSDGQQPGQSANPYVKIAIIPCREREILFLSSTGGGFSHILNSIPEGTVNATITPNAPFWFYAPSGVDMFFRVALCQFYASGNAVSKQSFFTFDPGPSPAGGFQTYQSADTPGSTTITVAVNDGVNPSSPYNNNTNGVCLNATLTGDGTYTPTLYGARGYTIPQVANTWGTHPLDVTEFLTELSYERADNISGTRWKMTLKNPKAIIAAGVTLDAANQPGALIDIIAERPWQIYDNGVQIAESMNESPRYIERTIIGPTGAQTYGTLSNQLESVVFDLRDTILLAENFRFKDSIPLDGMTFPVAYTLVTDMCGLTASTNGRYPNLDPSLSSVIISKAGNPTKGFNVEIQTGDTAWDWMDRLHKTYAASYAHGMTVQNGWNQPYMIAPGNMPSVAVQNLSDSKTTAIANGLDSSYLGLFRTMDVQMIKPEANEVFVEGYDYRTGRPILTRQFSDTNANPTVPPAFRSPAWRGQVISYAWIDPTIGDIDVASYANQLIYDRITPCRSLVEIECDFDPGLDAGQLLTLYFLPGGGVKSPLTGALLNPVTVRIKTISAVYKQLSTDGVMAKWRPTKYVGQVYIPGGGTSDASNLHTHGVSINSILHEMILHGKSKQINWGDALSGQIFRRPLILQQDV